MSELVFDSYNTVLGPVAAIRLTLDNIQEAAKKCPEGMLCSEVPEGSSKAVHYISLHSKNRHGKVVEDRADIGEWVVLFTADDNYGDVAVYEDKLFLAMVKDYVTRPVDEEKHENVAKILSQLMEYQDFVTGKGGGTAETESAAELAALQIWYEFR